MNKQPKIIVVLREGDDTPDVMLSFPCLVPVSRLTSADWKDFGAQVMDAYKRRMDERAASRVIDHSNEGV